MQLLNVMSLYFKAGPYDINNNMNKKTIFKLKAFVSDNDSSTRRVRRTERARRDSQRPDYFNSVVIDTQSKRGRRKSQSLPAHQVQGDNTATQASSDSSPVKRRRGRPRGTPNKPLLPDRTNTKTPPTPSTPPVEEDMHAELPQERIKQFQYILMDLNAKFCSQNFKPS